MLYLSILALCTQTTILFLTFAKQIFAARTGWGRTPLVSLMIRDGSFAFVAIFSERRSRHFRPGLTLLIVVRCIGSNLGMYDIA